MVEIGAILEGKVTGLTNFGAFVSLPDNKTGMVHISEVSSSYVNDIHDHLKEGQQVKVKVIDVTPEGKISLSIKKLRTIRSQTSSSVISRGEAANRGITLPTFGKELPSQERRPYVL